jgi:hypothetical protein
MQGRVTYLCAEDCEHQARLDAAIAALELSSARLLKTTRSDSDEAFEDAWSTLRMARVRFTVARAILRDHCQEGLSRAPVGSLQT